MRPRLDSSIRKLNLKKKLIHSAQVNLARHMLILLVINETIKQK